MNIFYYTFHKYKQWDFCSIKYFCKNFNDLKTESKRRKDSTNMELPTRNTDLSMNNRAVNMMKNEKDINDVDAILPKTLSPALTDDETVKLTIVNELRYDNKLSVFQNKITLTPIDQKVKYVHKGDEDMEDMCFINAGDEINALQNYMTKVAKDIQYLLNKISPNYAQICVDGISVALTAEVKKITVPNPAQTEHANHKMTIDRPLSFDSQQPPAAVMDVLPYYIPIQQQIKLTVKKFDTLSDDFFKCLSILYAVLQLLNKSSCNVPGLYIRNNWHVRNISQGFMLRIVLKNKHVDTLNIMRNLYFVIITTDSPNLSIEINFKLRNAIFAMFDLNVAPLKDYEIIEWNDEHEKIFDYTLSTNKVIVKINSHTGCSNYQPSNKESSKVNIPNLRWIHNLESESVFTNITENSSFIITETKSIATSIDNVIQYQLRSLQAYTTTVATSCSKLQAANYSIMHVLNTRYWRAKLCALLRMLKDFNTSLLTCDFIDESIFEKTSVDTNDCLSTHNTSMILKCLAHTFGCAVFSLFLSVF